jgi:hypothetical protein
MRVLIFVILCILVIVTEWRELFLGEGKVAHFTFASRFAVGRWELLDILVVVIEVYFEAFEILIEGE